MDATPSDTVPPSGPAVPHTAVVPAAGFGTRLRPLTNSLPKEMLPVGRELALERIVSELGAAGVRRVVFVLSEAKEPMVRGRFGEGTAAGGGRGMEFAYVLQPEMRGLGDAVLRAEPLVERGASFIVALGDAVFEEPAVGGLTRRLAEATAAAGPDALGLAVQRVPAERIGRYGIVKPAPAVAAAGGWGEFLPIVDIVEKPAPEEAPSDLAAAARYVLPSAVFDALRDARPGKSGEIQLTDALRALLAEGRPGVAVPLAAGEYRHDLGGIDSYLKAFTAFALADPEYGEGLRAYLAGRLSGSERSTK